MKRTVKIQKMFGGQSESEIKNFATERDARTYYRAFCDDHDMPDRGDWAGGIGHDYSITLCDDDPEPLAKWPDDIDWDSAPGFNFHAVNRDGRGLFFEKDFPLPFGNGMWFNHTWQHKVDGKTYDLTGIKWDTTLTARIITKNQNQ
jgi:hypothetical protein